MERTHVPFVVGSILALGLVLGGAVYRDVCAQQPQQPKRDRAAPQTYEGLEITGNQAKIKAGYTFVKISKSKGAVQRMRASVVEIDCACKSAGSCDIELIGDIVRCQPAGACTGCDRIVTVPGGFKPPARY